MRIAGWISLLTLLVGGATVAQTLPDGPLFMGFYETWTELPIASPEFTKLAQLPDSLDLVAIAFVKPSLTFDGVTLKSTGLEVPFDAPMLAKAIGALRKRNPKAKILLSVGGSGYNKQWPDYAPEQLLKLVKFLGADGVDLDYEPANPACAHIRLNDQSTINCGSEQEWVRIIRMTRAVFPRPYVVTAQAWSVGAYGVGDFARDIPPSPWTGSMLWLAKTPEAKELDVVAVMAYDSGPSFDPERAMAAYRAVWSGPLLMGIEVPSAESKELPTPVNRIKRLANVESKDAKGGILLYAVTEEVKAGPSLNRPDGELAAKAICEGLGRKGC